MNRLLHLLLTVTLLLLTIIGNGSFTQAASVTGVTTVGDDPLVQSEVLA